MEKGWIQQIVSQKRNCTLKLEHTIKEPKLLILDVWSEYACQ